MEKNNSFSRAGFSTILWGVLAILLCAAPCVWGEDKICDGGLIYNIDYEIQGSLIVRNATVNLKPGANIWYAVEAYPCSVVNIYGGEVGWWVVPYKSLTEYPDPNVTVYGPSFQVGTGEPFAPPADMPISDTLNVLSESGEVLFSLLLLSDIDIHLRAPGVTVEIDIKPGSDLNVINLGSNGVIPVAILSDADFDATTVLPETVSLAGSGVAVRGKGEKYLAHEEDVNGDGLTDLVVKVETENLDPGTFRDGLVTLTGQTSDGVQFTGSDYIIIVPPEG